MSNRDWFRKITWTLQDREDFFAHLSRSHRKNRAQYLKIQAYYLFETNSTRAYEVALELTNLALTEYPERIFLAELYEQKAKCLSKLSKLDDAQAAFQLAFDTMRAIPNIKPNAQFSFGLFVIEHNISQLYNEAIKVLDEFTDRLDFPVFEYFYYGIKAIILSREGNRIDARSLALNALEASKKTISGLPRHPQVGLVDKPDEILNAELSSLV